MQNLTLCGLEVIIVVVIVGLIGRKSTSTKKQPASGNDPSGRAEARFTKTERGDTILGSFVLWGVLMGAAYGWLKVHTVPPAWTHIFIHPHEALHLP